MCLSRVRTVCVCTSRWVRQQQQPKWHSKSWISYFPLPPHPSDSSTGSSGRWPDTADSHRAQLLLHSPGRWVTETEKKKKTWDMSFFVKRDIWGKTDFFFLFFWNERVWSHMKFITQSSLIISPHMETKIIWVVQKASLLWYLNYEHFNNWPTIFTKIQMHIQFTTLKVNMKSKLMSWCMFFLSYCVQFIYEFFVSRSNQRLMDKNQILSNMFLYS